MGVLKVNVGDAVAPDWRKIGCGTQYAAPTDVSPASGWTSTSFSAFEDQPALVYRTDPARSVRLYTSFGGSVWILDGYSGVVPGETYELSVWCRADPSAPGIQAQLGAAVGGGTYTLISANTVLSTSAWTLLTGTYTPSGSDLELMIFGATSGSSSTFDMYAADWTTFDEDEVLTPTPVAGRLKLWTGTEWVREVCDGDTPPFPTASNMASVWCAPTAPPHYFRAYSNGLPAATSIFHVQFLVGTGRQFNMSLLSGTPSGHAIWEATDTGSPVVSPGDTISSITCYDASINNLGTTTPSPSTVQTLVPPRPLKMWDGTSWVTVACLVPA